MPRGACVARKESMRILIIDDEASQRELLAGHLERQGHKVQTAGDGEEGIAVLRDSGAEAALVDMRMPRMDGLSLLQKLQEAEEKKSTIIVSAYGDMSNIRTAMNRGAFDFLTKPIDFGDLEMTIDKTIPNVLQGSEKEALSPADLEEHQNDVQVVDGWENAYNQQFSAGPGKGSQIQLTLPLSHHEEEKQRQQQAA